jgi:ribosome recycling factor
MSHPILTEATEKMDKSVSAFQSEMTSIRTGRA